MPLPRFDNLNDVVSKFSGTICYYKDEPVIVKAVFHDDDDPNKFLISAAPFQKDGKIIDVHDPDFRYVGYNIGYVNGTHTASWWYRRPAKQYQQGLKPEQLRFYSEGGMDNPKSLFGFSKPYVEMLRNNYPSLTEATKTVREGKMAKTAWHRDFAVAYNEIDDNFPLFYRASYVGFIKDGAAQLEPAASYLQEALKEAMGQ